MSFVSRSQQLIFQNRSDLKLPAQESYNVMQDSKGYIWISTEQGLCRYNGSSLKIFNKSNGLPEKSCYAVKEDKDGTIWIATSANRILKYKNDTLVEAPFSKAYANQLLKVQITYALSLSNDSVYMSAQIVSFAAGKKSSSAARIKRDSVPFHYFVKKENNLIVIKEEIASSNKRFNEIKKAGKYFIDIKYGNTLKRIEIPFTGQPPNWRVLSASNKNGDVFISGDDYVIRIDKNMNHTMCKLPHTVLSLYCDKDNGLWAGTLKGGVYYWKDASNIEKKVLNLKAISVTGICEDNEKGIWCTTLEKGIYYSANKHINAYHNFNGLNNRASLLTTVNGKVYASCTLDQLFELGEKCEEIKLTYENASTLTDMRSYCGGLLLAGKATVARKDQNFKIQNLIKSSDKGILIGANQLAGNDKKMLAMNYNYLYEIKSDMAYPKGKQFPAKANCIYYTGSKNILLGCDDGLYLADTSNYNFEKQKLNSKIVKINSGFEDQIWAFTKEDGVFILKEDLSIIDSLRIPGGLIFDATLDKYNTIWVAVSEGIIRIKKEGHKIEKTLYTHLNGLPNSEIYKVACDSFSLYFTGSEGVYSFNLKQELKNNTLPVIYLNTLKINDRVFSESIWEFTHDQNSIVLNFDVLSFKRLNTPRLVWTLTSGFETHAGSTDGNEIKLDNLSPDDYELIVIAENTDGVKSGKPVVIKFIINSPFWQTGWFIIVCGLILSATVYIIVKQITKRIKSREEEKTKINKLIAESQLSALQAQMNPHFIFNAINSIQNYILKKQEHEAYNYLAKFSKLIRMVLNNSQQKTLTLRQELETINLYVQLKQVRFKNSFEFELKLGDNIEEEEITVPTMLIQPYLENAIWHGLMNLDEARKGKLLLKIIATKEQVEITIEDNGIGRKQAMEYKKESKHKPVAMHLTEQRLHMINQMQDFEGAKVLVSDLHNENGEAMGTRVEIILPLIT